MLCKEKLTSEFPLGSANHWQIVDADALTLPQRQWLLDRESLTARLKAHCQRFHIEVLGQQPAPLFSDEKAALCLAEDAIVREVLLCCDDTPWVFARSVFPLSAASKTGLGLEALGNQSLGEQLFKDPDLQRSPIEIARFSQDSSVALLNQQLGYPNSALLGRRSVFSTAQQSLLVAEIFLGSSPLYGTE